MVAEMRMVTVAVVLLTVIAGSLGAQTAKETRTATPPGPRAERKVPYAVGERLAYDVSWANYLSAGTVMLHVEAKRPSYNSTAYYIVAEARTEGLLASFYTLYYKADTLIDAFTTLPQRGSVYSKEGSRERNKVTTFDHPRKQGRFEMQTASKMVKELSLGTATQDLLSAVYALRALAPQSGEKFSMPVSDSGWLYQVLWTVGEAEAVTVASGQTVRALRLTPQVTDENGESVGSGSVLWLATDGSFRPVRMEAATAAGRIVVTLK